jgi:hypothetical protein
VTKANDYIVGLRKISMSHIKGLKKFQISLVSAYAFNYLENKVLSTVHKKALELSATAENISGDGILVLLDISALFS